MINNNVTTLFILLSLSSQLMAIEKATLDCLVKPEMFIQLSSPVDTTIKKLYVDRGDAISKGQTLVVLENSVQIAKLNFAKSQALSWSGIEDRRVQLKYAERNKKRIADLYAKKSVPLLEKDKADTEVALAKIGLIKAKEKRNLATLSLRQTKAELALRTIKSPINGIVIERFIQVGESVSDKPIMKLAQINPLKIELIAPTEYFGLIKKGLEVDIYPERPAGSSYKATVTVVDQLIDPASGSFTVRMSLPNDDKSLVGGINCLAKFDFSPPKSNDDAFKAYY